MTTFDIRTASTADLDDVRDVYRRSSLSNEGDRANLLANPNVLLLSADAIEQGRLRVAVEPGGRIVGFASIQLLDSAVEVEDLFVDPDWMRQGIGTQLVLDIADTAQRDGIQHVEVTANSHAMTFYRSLGFVVDHHVETQFGSAPRMSLDVTA